MAEIGLGNVTFGEHSSCPSEARLHSGDPACSSDFVGNHARKQGLTSPKATFPRLEEIKSCGARFFLAAKPRLKREEKIK